MKYICPLVLVKDIEKAKFFYTSILKQTIKTDYGENVVFHGDFSIHQREHYSQLIDGKEIITRANNFELYFEENKIEEVLDRLKQNNVELVHDIMEQPWRQRVIRFYDYDYNIIEVGESMEYVAYRLHKENKSIEEICRITYLSEMSVENAIREFS